MSSVEQFHTFHEMVSVVLGAMCQSPNNRLQRTVRDKVPASITQCPAAEPGR
jgi:hypothetical protein